MRKQSILLFVFIESRKREKVTNLLALPLPLLLLSEPRRGFYATRAIEVPTLAWDARQ